MLRVMFQRTRYWVPFVATSVLLALGMPRSLPRDLPPLLAMAEFCRPESKAADGSWELKLTVPKIRWVLVGEVVPKKSWPKLRVGVQKVELHLHMGTLSQLAPSRVVDMKGRELDRKEIQQRLQKETPVLVALSGRMPDSYHLQLTRSDALIVILGARDLSPAVSLMPARKKAGNQAGEVQHGK